MQEPDWVPLADPAVLWINTAMLIVASVLMQRARNAARNGLISGVRNNLTFAGLLSIAFLVG